MHVAQLALTDFRSYSDADMSIEAGVTAFIGPNGQGKTNIVEAVGYLGTLGSHRVSHDAPLVRVGAERAVVRGSVREASRSTLLEVEITPGRANRARINRSPVSKPREILGLLRTVLFAPEDLALVKGEPAVRRRFLDELLVSRTPRYAAVRSDYDRVLKQRNALLKSAGQAMRSSHRNMPDLQTLDVWDSHLAKTGAELLAGRLELVDALQPLVGKAYDSIAAVDGSSGGTPRMDYESSLGQWLEQDIALTRDREVLAGALLDVTGRRRNDEIERGVSLVGPHRDDVLLSLGPSPAKGYASQGESWSFALALRLASFELLRSTGTDPVLILDDVFAELDANRRHRLAELVAEAEQVLVTAAVPDDVPEVLSGARFDVMAGEVRQIV